MEMFSHKKNEYKLIEFIDMTIADPSFLAMHDDVFSNLSITRDTDHGLEARIYVNYRKGKWDGNIYSPKQEEPLLYITDWKRPVIKNREIHYPVIFSIAYKKGEIPKWIHVQPFFKNCYIYINNGKHIKAKRDIKYFSANCDYEVV